MLTSFIEYHRNKRRSKKMKRRKDFVKRRSVKFFRRFIFLQVSDRGYRLMKGLVNP